MRYSIRASVALLCLMLVGAVMLGLPADAHAAEVFVDPLFGSDTIGDGSVFLPFRTLGAGIGAADEGDTVWGSAGVYGESISLASGVRVVGAGSDVCTIRGETSPTVSAVGVVNAGLSGFTISGGYSIRGVSLVGASVLLDSLAISECWSSGSGGGLFAQDAVYTLEDSTVENCAAVESGGGVCSVDSTATIRATGFLGNPSGVAGGGLYIERGTATVVDCEFEANNATDGAGLFVSDGAPTISQSAFVRNMADNGAAIGMVRATPLIDDCDLVENYAGDMGGGLAVDESSPEITYCTIQSNQAGYGAGVSYAGNSGGSMWECIISENRAGVQGGGALIADGSDPAIRGCEIRDNEAYGPLSLGGGVACITGSRPTIELSRISRNTASQGGGLGVLRAEPILVDSLLRLNSAGNGGGLYSESATPTLSGCTVEGNDALVGAGLFLISGGTQPEIRDSRFTQNTATHHGAGIWVQSVDPIITNCVVDGNYIPAMGAGEGGGMRLDSSDAVVTNCTVTDNYTVGTGGGIYVSGGSPVITNCVMSFNTGGDLVGSGSATYSNIGSGVVGGQGNIGAAPIFVNRFAGDYRLDAGSRGIDEATETVAPACDHGGVERPLDGDNDGIARSDMGAFEYAGASPHTTLDPDAGRWRSAPVTVTITASDDGTVTATYYRVDSGAVSTYTVPFVVSAPGTTTIDYWSVDDVGNVETEQSAIVRIDLAAPVTVDDAPIGWADGPMDVTLSATDDRSGVVSTEWWTGANPIHNDGVGPIHVSADGTHTISYCSRDLAGNVEATKTATVMVDATPPTTSCDATGTYGGPATIDLTPTDAHSGVATTHFRLDEGGWETGTSIAVSALGDHVLDFRSIDVAGNVEATSSVEFTIVPGATVYHGVAGSDRFGTAVAASQAGFPSGATAVVLATGHNWPDALGGAALAGAVDGPILLVDSDDIPDVVAAEITRLGATSAFILGGTSAVGPAVATELTGLGVGDVTRLGGTDRYETAGLIADAVIDVLGGSFDGNALLATGAGFSDALAGSPMAAAGGWPIYLADAGASPAALAARMQADRVTDVLLLGGTAAVSTDYETALAAALSGDVTRLAGSDRYATCASVAEYGVASAGLAYDGLALATGDDFPDALAGGVLCARNGSVILLTDGKTLSNPVARVLADNRDHIADVYFMGGTSAVSRTVRDQVAAILR